MLQCLACNGVYAPVLSDGTQYFHVCPPLSAVELAAAVLAGKLVLPVGETPDVAVTRRNYIRAGQRDENVKSTAAADAGSMKLPGAGTKPGPVPPPGVVPVP